MASEAVDKDLHVRVRERGDENREVWYSCRRKVCESCDPKVRGWAICLTNLPLIIELF